MRKSIQYLIGYMQEKKFHTSKCSSILSSKPIAVELLETKLCMTVSTRTKTK